MWYYQYHARYAKHIPISKYILAYPFLNVKFYKGVLKLKRRADGLYQKKVIIDGKAKFFYGKSQKIVQQKIDEFKKSSNKNALTFKEAAELWEEEHKEKIAYKTWMGYQAHYKRSVEYFSNTPIADIVPQDVNTYLKKTMISKGYAYKTVKTALNVISLIFDKAILEGILKTNPCECIKIPNHLPKTKRELPCDADLQKVKDSVNCHFGLFAYFLLYTGLRRGEALALTYEDIDFENKIIAVNKAVYFESNHPKLKSTKTEAGMRNVILLDCLADKLKKNEKGYIFNSNGNLMTEQAFRRAWERYTKESNLTITPHQLRHAYATILYDAEIDAKSAQQLLGHSDYKTTLEIYTHISDARKTSVADKLNSFVKK